MRILFLSRWFPFPPDNGSKLRIHGLLQGLAACHEVTLLSFVEKSDYSHDPAPSWLKKTKVTSWPGFEPGALKARLSLFSPLPRYFSATFSAQMRELITIALAETDFDIIVASQIETARYRPYFNRVPAIFDEIEVGTFYDRLSSGAGWTRLRSQMTWVKHWRFVKKLVRSFDASTVVSEKEQALVETVGGERQRVHVIPNFIDVDSCAPFHRESALNTLIFPGSLTYAPNHQGVTWFLEHVFPKILQRQPETTLTVTGDHGNLPLPAVGCYRLTGRVPDVRPLVAQSSVCIAPIFSGGGSRLKILEAMALGTPVVATTKAAEGLELRAGEDLLVADDPVGFAEAILLLLSNPGIRRRLVQNAFDVIRAKYDSVVVIPKFLALVERVARHPSAAE